MAAYVAIERWAPGRVVVVVAPHGADGPLRLRDAGARVVVVGGAASATGVGLDVRPGVPMLPLPDGSAHLVACLEGWAGLDASQRARVVLEARRVLVPEGLFAAWSRQPRSGEDGVANPMAKPVDFWALERELGEAFERVQMFAQLPWRGFSVAPVLDDDRAPPIVVREGLLRDAPQASHYLAIAGARAAESRLADAVQCVLVPLDPEVLPAMPEWASSPVVPGLVAPVVAPAGPVPVPVPVPIVDDEAVRELATTRAALVRAEEAARTRETDLAVLTRSLREHEQTSARNGEQAAQRGRELEERNVALADLRARVDAGVAERDQLARQLEVAAVEREGARQLASRLEAEIDFARRRAATLEEQLTERSIEASRLGAEASMLRERVEQQERALTQTRSRAEELSATAARSAEQGRIHAEIAFDRDRLREELARRTQVLEKLEEKLWSTRDDAQRDRIEVVRTTADLERLREQLERARQVEQDRGQEIERLAGELRRAELERTEALAAVRMRDEEATRLRRELDAMASKSGDLQRLRAELEGRATELAEIGARLEQATAREREAQALAKRREQQLVDAGRELERLRAAAEDHAAQGTGLQGELDVRMVELEQLAASVGDLQHQVEATRIERREVEARATELQHQLEQLAAEREMLRRHLREREQELDDVTSAQESSGAELFLLRRELDATAEVNERLTTVLQNPPAADPQMQEWPPAAVAEVQRLRSELASVAERSAAEAQPRAEDVTPERARMRRLQLELEIRAQEHEQVLTQLDAAEQRIWEMTDASDRNAARLAAGLAQLEKQREQYDDTLEELEVTRNLLAAAQARAIEQARLLASERAKLARVGIGEGVPRLVESDGIEDLFADLDDVVERPKVDTQPIRLPTVAALAQVAERRSVEVERLADDGGRAATDAESSRSRPSGPTGPDAPGVPQPQSEQVTSGSRPIDLTAPGSTRVVVEPLPDDAWREPD